MISPTDMADLNESTLWIAPIERAETIPSSWYVDASCHLLDGQLGGVPAP